MKNLWISLILLTFFSLPSCSDDEKDDTLYADYLVARPVKMTKAEFLGSVEVIPPRPIEESGKIYTYQDFIFVNDMYKGVHVIDNSNPAAPRKVSFIKIAGNVDISVKGDYLYADSLSDLIVLDLSDIDNIRIVNRLFNVLNNPVIWPVEADIFEYDGIDFQNEVLLGWEMVTERRLIEDVQPWREDVFLAEMASDVAIGQGGSLARFKIVEDFLYAVDNHYINIFDIRDLANPAALEDVYAGFDIETLFFQGRHLFLGSRSGMYIYDIADPARPLFVSEFQHGTACDPVVVDGSYAFVTLRGGNSCGAAESGLYIVDISVLTAPILAISYPMDEPYGLGVKDNLLFLCDGASGLKVYDKSDIQALEQVQQLTDVVAYDVIPLEKTLLLVGDGELHQYEYLGTTLGWISTLQLN